MKSYSRRELYALGEPLGDSATYRKVDGGLILGGGGGGQPSQTTSTSYQTNIPEYARPYVETMLGATQKQLFQGTPSGDGGFNITGFQPYKAYGGTYDAQGNQTSYDPSKAIAGFSPLQRQAQQGIGNLQVPGQFNQAMRGTTMAGMGGMNVANQATTGGFQNQVGGYMNPYLDMALQPALQEAQRQYGITGTQQQSAATQAGAFGGSREAIMAAENERNKNTAMNQIIGQGYNQAFQGAQQQYNQNMQNQLAGYGLTNQASGQLAGIAGQQLGAEQGIYGAQNQMGAQQQAQQQQIINQSMQDYANAQQYPLMQLGTMSNMIRGLPMQAQTTNQYAAAPNQLTQGIGAAGATASLYNAFGDGNSSGRKAEGGVIKSMASGGIASVPRYDVGGEVKDQLASMDIPELEKQARESSSPTIREMARELLREKKMAQAPQGVGPMGINYQAPQMAASGGIIAFREPTEENNNSLVKDSFMDRINAAATGPAEAGIPEPKAADLGAVPLTNYNSLPEIAAMQMEAKKQTALADRNTADIAAEIKAQAGPDVGRENYRKTVMAEKANSADEAYRQKQMRLAEFFASWGTTPGTTLVAGMTALKKSIPGMIEDEREVKKLRRESDKIMFDLDNAIRLEEQGYAKEARAQKEKAAERAMHLNQYIGTNAVQLKREEMGNAAMIEKEKIHSKATLAGVSQRAAELAAAKNEVLLAAAARDLNETRQKIANRNSKDEQAQKDATSVTMYNTQLSNAEGDASKVSAYIKNEYEQARKRISDRNKADAKIEKVAENNYARTYKKVTGEDYLGTDTNAPPPTATSDLSTQDRQALDWANSNPNDPRSATIKKRLGV